MTPQLRRRIGFEIELLAPPGASRRTLAGELAGRCGGRVRPVWHHDSEPSLVPGLGRFLHLTQGFQVLRPDGGLLCTLVDDVTLVHGLDPRLPATPGWHRILTDDTRLLHLLARRCDPGAPLPDVLTPVAGLWDTGVQQHGRIFRLDDPAGATVALAAPAGGERERPCEIVTPPIAAEHHTALEELLAPARELGFTVPHEAAVHLHVDGAPFRSPAALANVVRLFAHYRAALWELLATNPACRRLAALPAPLVSVVAGNPGTGELRSAAADGGLTKFFDVNLTQVLTDTPVRDTVEIRILPGTLDAGEIVHRAALIDLLLTRCTDPVPIPAPPDPGSAVETVLELAAEGLHQLDGYGR